MKASELIEDLKILIGERGDLDVINADEESVMISYNGDVADEEVFIIE